MVGTRRGDEFLPIGALVFILLLLLLLAAAWVGMYLLLIHRGVH